MKRAIILASSSKRRSKILKECAIPHTVMPSMVEEIMDHKRGPAYSVRVNARRKASCVAKRLKKGYVIGADTIVLLGRRLIGKPKDRREAKALLKAMSGKTIYVYTGLCVIDTSTYRSATGMEVTKLKVKRLSTNRMREFLRVAGPYDKAGGFSIEGPGSLIFDNVEGSFYNVLGLPMGKLSDFFERLGVNLLTGKGLA